MGAENTQLADRAGQRTGEGGGLGALEKAAEEAYGAAQG
jgi:hypothetical protein